MYGFEEKEFLSVMHGAADNIEKIEQAVDAAFEKGYENIFLVGSGGTYSVTSPIAYLLKTESTLEWYHEIAAELVAAKPKKLGAKSLMITASLTGTTKETNEAAEYAVSVGADVIALVGDTESPLGKTATYAIGNAASNDNLSEELNLQLTAMAAYMMKKNGDIDQDRYDRLVANLRKMPEVLLEVRRENNERALAFATKHKDTKFHMCVGAGNTWGETYCFAMCVLEEMQWIATKSIHAAEFFHGTVEMTEKDMSFMLFKGEDATRALVDRVENFVNQYSDVVQIWDTKDYKMEGIDADMRTYVAPMVMATQLERVSAHFEHLRNHSLDIRRYYRTVKY